MINSKLALTFLVSMCCTGCSMIGEHLPDLSISRQNINVETTTKAMIYNFILPRRKPSPQFSREIARPSSKLNTYYSASGYKCKITTPNKTEPICFINGVWQEAAPILHSSTD